ncbi:hypothetical protein FA15DRAFT_761003 [Coprinopsis marcescibilis]|uniref:Uncharacterized protein n=1 Tax=Coprinopsis marcescibilis TaxID=230819 RepID=A0A5C3KCW4_COPMA|nr:hypothetical protein FA15DRAFT_761003 [Coprinopsis marcescibilis]
MGCTIFDARTKTKTPSPTKLLVYEDPPGETPAVVQTSTPKRKTRTASTPDDLSLLCLFATVLGANNRNDENLYVLGLVPKHKSSNQPTEVERKPFGLVWSIEPFPARRTPVAPRTHRTTSQQLSEMLSIGKTLSEYMAVATPALILVLRNGRFP